MTSTKYGNILLLILALLVIPIALQAQEPVEHGRISFAGEDGLIKGPQDADWSYAGLNSIVTPGDTIWADEQGVLEVEFTGGNFLRLADGSRLDIVSVPPRALLRGWTGSFYLQRTPAGSGEFVFETPVGRVSVDPDSQVRVDILDDGTTTVSVRWGRASVHTDAGMPVNLTAGQRTYIDPGYQPSAPEDFDRSYEDAFDAWNRERARSIALGGQNVPIAAAGNVDAPIGYSDLNDYGDWVYVDDQTYWKPTVVDYVPYRSGYWSYVPVQGHVWVGDYPFAYVTSHHGHWRYHHHHGWIWAYTHHYSPAYVFSVSLGDSFIWAPLSVHGQPVHYGDDYFHVGGIRFSIGFSSFSLSVNLLGGQHHSYALYDHHIDYRHHSYHSDYHYWNIHAQGSHYASHAQHHYDDRHVRTHTPDRVLRGSERHAIRADHARARVARLESKTGRDRFAVTTRTAKRAARTAGVSRQRQARVHDVQIRPEALKRTSRRVQTAGTGSAQRIRVARATTQRASADSTRATRAATRTGSTDSTRGTRTTRSEVRGDGTNRDRAQSAEGRKQVARVKGQAGAKAEASNRAAVRRSANSERPKTVISTRRSVAGRTDGNRAKASGAAVRGTGSRATTSHSTSTRPKAVGTRVTSNRSSGVRNTSPPATRRETRSSSVSRTPISRSPAARIAPQPRTTVNRSTGSSVGRSTRAPQNRNVSTYSRPSTPRSIASSSSSTRSRPAPSSSFRAPSISRSTPSVSSRSSSISRSTPSVSNRSSSISRSTPSISSRSSSSISSRSSSISRGSSRSSVSPRSSSSGGSRSGGSSTRSSGRH